jgi:hypothetical protein
MQMPSHLTHELRVIDTRLAAFLQVHGDSQPPPPIPSSENNKLNILNILLDSKHSGVFLTNPTIRLTGSKTYEFISFSNNGIRHQFPDALCGRVKKISNVKYTKAEFESDKKHLSDADYNSVYASLNGIEFSGAVDDQDGSDLFLHNGSYEILLEIPTPSTSWRSLIVSKLPEIRLAYR